MYESALHSTDIHQVFIHLIAALMIMIIITNSFSLWGKSDKKNLSCREFKWFAKDHTANDIWGGDFLKSSGVMPTIYLTCVIVYTLRGTGPWQKTDCVQVLMYLYFKTSTKRFNIIKICMVLDILNSNRIKE